MARIAGIDLPRNKRMEVALTYIVGIGPRTSRTVLAQAGIDLNTRSHALTEEQASAIRRVIESSYPVEGDVRREVSSNIKRLMDLGTYVGLRHRKGLPVHGQRTRTNSKTRKGRGKAVAGKKKPTKK